MTTDPKNQNHPLEADLARYRPAPLSPELRNRIATHFADQSLTLADRILATTATLGSIAAGVILCFAIWQLTRPIPPHLPLQNIALRQKITMEYQSLVAAK